MPTEKKVWGVRGGFGTPHLQGENAAEPTIARIHTDFSSFSYSLINANAMPTLCQRERQILPRNANGKAGQDWKIALRCEDPVPGAFSSPFRESVTDRGVNAAVPCMV